jgi:hypothetical protein
MTLTEYRKAKQNNSKILEKCLVDRTTDLSEIIFWEGVTGKTLSFDLLLSKSYDILGCVAIGAIPTIAKTGADGYMYNKDDKDDNYTIHEVETKVCAIESKNIHIGSRGGLYWSSNPTRAGNKAGIQSYFNAKFDFGMSDSTMNTKARYTALICFDRDTNQIIDCFYMKPKQVLKELRRRHNGNSLDLKLSCFIENGGTAQCQVPSIGWDNWINEQRTSATLNKRFI